MSSQHGYVQDLITGPPLTSMGYNRLGKSGLKVSKIILGAMSYGSKDWRKWVLEEDEALPLLEHAYKAGINTWDTVSVTLYLCLPFPRCLMNWLTGLNYQADLYSNGVSEEIIAKALSTYKIPRERVVIMTKCRFAISGPGEPQLSPYAATVNDGEMVNRVGLSRKHIFDAAKASVQRLGTYIDVLQIQRMDPDVSREEIMKALNDVVEAGLARYIGASSVSLSGPTCTEVLTRQFQDACLGVSGVTECGSRTWLASVHFYAELLQPSLPGGGARDDTLLQRCGGRMHSCKFLPLYLITRHRLTAVPCSGPPTPVVFSPVPGMVSTQALPFEVSTTPPSEVFTKKAIWRIRPPLI